MSTPPTITGSGIPMPMPMPIDTTPSQVLRQATLSQSQGQVSPQGRNGVSNSTSGSATGKAANKGAASSAKGEQVESSALEKSSIGLPSQSTFTEERGAGDSSSWLGGGASQRDGEGQLEQLPTGPARREAPRAASVVAVQSSVVEAETTGLHAEVSKKIMGDIRKLNEDLTRLLQQPGKINVIGQSKMVSVSATVRSLWDDVKAPKSPTDTEHPVRRAKLADMLGLPHSVDDQTLAQELVDQVSQSFSEVVAGEAFQSELGRYNKLGELAERQGFVRVLPARDEGGTDAELSKLNVKLPPNFTLSQLLNENSYIAGNLDEREKKLVGLKPDSNVRLFTGKFSDVAYNLSKIMNENSYFMPADLDSALKTWGERMARRGELTSGVPDYKQVNGFAKILLNANRVCPCYAV